MFQWSSRLSGADSFNEQEGKGRERRGERGKKRKGGEEEERRKEEERGGKREKEEGEGARTFMFTLIYVIARFILEVLYVLLDPRVRY